MTPEQFFNLHGEFHSAKYDVELTLYIKHGNRYEPFSKQEFVKGSRLYADAAKLERWFASNNETKTYWNKKWER